LERLDPRVAGHLERVLADHRVEAIAQQAVEDLGADLLAEALADHAGRDLARAEPLDPGGARDLAQPAADLGLDVAGRDAQRHAAPEGARVLDRNLRCWNCHTHSVRPRPGRGGVCVIVGDRPEGPAERDSFADSGRCRHKGRRGLVRKAGLEPARLAAPAPKAGASTSSATFAGGRLYFGGKRKRPALGRASGSGGPSRIRTLDLLIKSQLLYQLS